MGRPAGFPDALNLEAAFPRQPPDLRLADAIPPAQRGLGASVGARPDAAEDAPVPAPSVGPYVEKLVDLELDVLELGAKAFPAQPRAALALYTQVSARSAA